jgi:hypothetical protein
VQRRSSSDMSAEAAAAVAHVQQTAGGHTQVMQLLPMGSIA